jgi:hypothetical protein
VPVPALASARTPVPVPALALPRAPALARIPTPIRMLAPGGWGTPVVTADPAGSLLDPAGAAAAGPAIATAAPAGMHAGLPARASPARGSPGFPPRARRRRPG